MFGEKGQRPRTTRGGETGVRVVRGRKIQGRVFRAYPLNRYRWVVLGTTW
jgi:hypothetical protein